MNLYPISDQKNKLKHSNRFHPAQRFLTYLRLNNKIIPKIEQVVFKQGWIQDFSRRGGGWLAGTLGLQNQQSMSPKCDNLRIRSYLKTVAPAILAVGYSRKNTHPLVLKNYVNVRKITAKKVFKAIINKTLIFSGITQ